MKKNKVFVTAGLAAVMAIGIFIYALNNSKFMIKFDTDGGSEIETQNVKKGDKVNEPEQPTKEGYVFVEWQLDGKKYNFKDKVTKNITLKAKWLPEIYVTVSFDTTGGSEIAQMSVLSGSTIKSDSIEVPVKEGYTFAGWYIGENKYNFDKKVTSNLTLVAKWLEGENVEIPEEPKEDVKVEEPKKEEVVEEKKEETSKKEDKKETSKETKKEDKKDTSKNVTSNTASSEKYKVGDKVIITGEYSGACDGQGNIYNIAIGWEREILAVYDDAEYPYQVGDKTGTTGFFKADSLKIKD